MAKPKGIAVARTAAALLQGATIPYTGGGETLAGMDCQGLVEYCVRACGGSMSFSGSNDMFRNACAWLGTLAEAKAQGKLVPGTALFILEQDGGEPAKYKADGLGNASHVGLYTDTGGTGPEVVHASASRGCVAASTLKNAWTHVGWLKAVDYGTEGTVTDMSGWAVTVADSGTTVNMRTASNGAYMLKIPLGAQVPVAARSAGWAKVRYNGFDGWVDEQYLRYLDGQEDMPGTGDTTAWGKVRQAYKLLGEALGEGEK